MNEDIFSRNNLWSTVWSDVRIADKLDTTVEAFTADKRNTESSGIIESAPKSIFIKESKQFDSSGKINLANSVPVETPELVSFRDPPIQTHNLTDGSSSGVATSIDDKDRIWTPRPSDIGTVATHDDLKNINEKLVFRKYLNELDFETIQILQRDHRARENMKNIETRLKMTWLDEQKMKMKERETIDDIPTQIETIRSEPISDIPTRIEIILSEPISTSDCENNEPKVNPDQDPPPSDSSDPSSSDSEHKRKKRKDKKKASLA